MKNVYVLSGIMVLGSAVYLHSMEQERPVAYQMIDPLTSKLHSKMQWQAIFKVLDEMDGVIDVNEYRGVDSGYTLLGSAVGAKDFLVAKTLLEKYKADPNILIARPLVNNKTPLMRAAELGDIPMIKLLLSYGADPNVKNSRNEDSFDYALQATNKSEVLKVLVPLNKGEPISRRQNNVRRAGRRGGGHSGAGHRGSRM